MKPEENRLVSYSSSFASKSVVLSLCLVGPEEAYVLRLQDAIQEIPGSALQGVENLTVGIKLQSQDEQSHPFIVTVTKIESETITVDTNHPLAGETLHFSVSINSIRDAQEEEISHGYVHLNALQ